jgi:hypothetical protein
MRYRLMTTRCDCRQKPNKAPEPTTMAVTSVLPTPPGLRRPSLHETRQPRSWLIWNIRHLVSGRG